VVREGEAVPNRRVPALFEPPPFLRLHGRARVIVLVAILSAAAAAAFIGANAYPDSAPPNATGLERKVVSVFGDPTVKAADDKLIGDFLVERFYILDELTGDRYIADFLKGTIRGVQNINGDESEPSYVFLLDLSGLKRDEPLLNAYVNLVSNPEEMGAGSYVGLTAATGTTDAFAMNYSGALPDHRSEFRGPDGEDLQTFLLTQKYESISDSPRLMSVEGYNYLLSNSDAFPLFKNQFGLGRAVFLSELLVLDATSKADRTQYFRLFNSYPRRFAGR
jgi:hypothetical protein